MRKWSITFIKSSIASGALIPPRNEAPLSPSDRVFTCIGWVMVVLGAGALAVAYCLHRM